MPERKSKRRAESTEIQGEDSYVVFRALTSGEIKTLTERPEGEEEKAASERIGRQSLALRILEWNWVDEAGAPLALPRDDLGVLDGLLEHEMNWLLAEVGKPL